MSIDAKDVLDVPVGKQHRLSGKMGALSLALTVLAFSAPLTTVSGYIPVALMFGGVGSPLAFIIATAAILIFALGYVSLNSTVKRPGDFYAFISYGLGKSIGLGAGLTAAVSYFLILAGVASFFGVSGAELQKSLLGWALPWYDYTLVCWFVVAVLGYLHVELSAKVLSWVMLTEVIICLSFSFGVIGSAHPDLPALAPFSPSELNKSGVNVPFTLLFIVSFFMGFEATALFRDEVRLPEKTIPLATYGAIIFIGVLYTLCAYVMIMVYGSDIQSVAQNAPATMFSDAFAKYVSPKFSLIVTVLVLTSSFASVLSVHNVLSRYLHNLGTDGALPNLLKKVHPRHSSPYIASFTVSFMVLLILIPFILNGVKPDLLYGQLAGVGSAGVIILMATVCFSALACYFHKGRTQKMSFLSMCVAPAVSSVFFIGLVFLVIKNFDLLVGGEPGERRWMLYCLIAVLGAGALLAQYFKHMHPEIFAKLGRSHIDIEG
ncbi:APC family permease [Klebsiella variicola subsp. variicola]|nr:APC family permease [Klebsiella variicola subsp. variicola]